jgi:hypothetical protein
MTRENKKRTGRQRKRDTLHNPKKPIENNSLRAITLLYFLEELLLRFNLYYIKSNISKNHTLLKKRTGRQRRTRHPA